MVGQASPPPSFLKLSRVLRAGFGLYVRGGDSEAVITGGRSASDSFSLGTRMTWGSELCERLGGNVPIKVR
jgi:hypothetical protein